MVWDPKRITPQPWAAVVEQYRRIEERNHDFSALRSLAEHVVAGPYATRLFAATSGTSLLVAPRADADWVQASLRVDLDLGGSIRFVFQGRAPAKPTIFQCQTQNLVKTFEGFVQRSQWV